MTQQLTKDDLRGCPFCGGLGDIEQIESGCFGVGCQDCDFQLMNGTIGLGWHKSESDAIRAWNERNSDLCIQGLQDWTKKLQSSLDAANSRIAELEQGKCLLQIAEPAAQGLEADGMYYLQDARHHAMVGNCPSFWREGGGYTTNLDEAEHFTLEAAIKQHKCRETDLPWLCSEVDKLRRPTVDCQYMPRSWDTQRAALAAQAKQGGAA